MKNSGNISTPAYYFDTDVFEKRIDFVNRELPGIPLTFSIKANPFLLSRLPQNLRHVEVCSPGELKICKAYGIPGSRIIYGFLELHRSFKIHSKQFVYETLIGWGLNPEKTYSFKGEYLEEQKMVVFSLKNTD